MNGDNSNADHNGEPTVADDEQPTAILCEGIDDRPRNNKPLSFRKVIVRYVCCYGTTALLFLAAFLAAGFALSYYRHNSGNDRSKNKNKDEVIISSRDWSDEEYQARYRLFRSYANALSNELTFLQGNTAQTKALDWLVDHDTSLSHDDDVTASFDHSLSSLPGRFAVRYALVVLYFACDSTGTSSAGAVADDNAADSSSSSTLRWLGDPDAATCDWPTVTCDDDTNETVIVALTLHDVLMGQLPIELSLLSTLTSLDLARNALEGTIPAIILANLTNLETLDLSSNNLAGNLPSELGRLTRLTYLDISQNHLEGIVPNELQYLSNLVSAKLSYNQELTAQNFFIDFVQHWKYLQILHGGQTQLSGTIGHLPATTLRELDLSSATGITGDLSNLPLMPNLSVLILADNSLHGPLPSFDRLPNVEILTLQANAFSGTISSDIGQLSKLAQFQLVLSNVQGRLPTEIGLCSNLQLLFITGNNGITGTLPSELGDLPNLRSLTVDNNHLLQGRVPTTLCQALQTGRLMMVRDCNVECDCCPENGTT